MIAGWLTFANKIKPTSKLQHSIQTSSERDSERMNDTLKLLEANLATEIYQIKLKYEKRRMPLVEAINRLEATREMKR